MRKENERPAELDRRRLLKGAGLAIGAAGATAALARSDAVACEGQAKPQQQSGYRESEDVKTYYRLARS